MPRQPDGTFLRDIGDGFTGPTAFQDQAANTGSKGRRIFDDQQDNAENDMVQAVEDSLDTLGRNTMKEPIASEASAALRLEYVPAETQPKPEIVWRWDVGEGNKTWAGIWARQDFATTGAGSAKFAIRLRVDDTVNNEYVKIDKNGLFILDRSTDPGSPAFDSGELSYTNNSSQTLAHGRSQTPKRYSGTLICKTAEAGYAVDDQIQMPDSDSGATLSADATNINLAISTDGFKVIPKTGGAAIQLTPANWRAIIRVWG